MYIKYIVPIVGAITKSHSTKNGGEVLNW